MLSTCNIYQYLYIKCTIVPTIHMYTYIYTNTRMARIKIEINYFIKHFALSSPALFLLKLHFLVMPKFCNVFYLPR